MADYELKLNEESDRRDNPEEPGTAEFAIRAAERRAGIGRKDLKPTDHKAKKISKLKGVISLLLGDDDDELGQDAGSIKSRIEQRKELSPEVETPPEER